MSELFLKIVNMSISASWVVIAVLTLRFCLKKAPKWVNVLLWGIVAARMVFPFSIESVLSLIPSAETISPTIMMEQTPSVQTGVPALNHVINPVISGSFTPAPDASANPLQIWIPILTGIWLFGVAALFLYSAASYWRLRPRGLRSGNPTGQHLSKREYLLSVCAGNHQTQNLSSVSYGQPRDGSCDCP